MNKALILFVSFLVLPTFFTVADSATKPLSISALEKNVKNVQKEVDAYAKDISYLESQLGKTHKKYLSTMQLRQKLESKLNESESNLVQSQSETRTKIEKLKTVLKRLALQELDRNQNAAAMAARKVLSKQVSKQLTALKNISKDAADYDAELQSIRSRIKDYQETESRLAQLVQTMEEQKNTKAEEYLQAISKKSAVEEKLSAIKLTRRVKARIKSDIDSRFSSPVDDFVGIEYDKKGITYKFNGRRPVLASENGKIAYAGRLSTYGNVVLIDHGNETRSVILGSFLPKLKKGQTVSKGDIIGYTEANTNQGKIYFEVRKRDKAQDTIALMDKTFLQKHKVTKI